jgi:hypothetical protein
LMSDVRVNPADQNNLAIIEACKKCDDNIQSLLDYFNSRAQDNQFIDTEIPAWIIQKLLKLNNQSITEAKKCYDIVKLLLTDQRTNPLSQNYKAIIEVGNKFHVLHLIYSNTRLNLSTEIREIIIETSKIYEDIILLFLNDHRINPKNTYNIFINLCINGYNNMVKLFLKNSKIIPDYRYDDQIINAISNHNLELTRLLINNPEYIDQDNVLAFYVLDNIKGGSEYFKLDQFYISILSTLINHPNFNPFLDGDIIVKLSEKNIYTALILILRNSKVNPGVQSNQAIINASQKGHFHIVKLLLSDIRVNSNDQDNKAITLARQNGHHKIVELLASHNNGKLNIN